MSWRWQMTFYIRLAFTSGLALRIQGAAYFTKSQLSETYNTGRQAGLVTRMVACTENPVLRIWCPSHQIDLVDKSSSNGIAGGTWVAFACSFSVSLRAQANLITSMGAKCPKKTNRWTHLGRLLTFFKKNRRKLVEFTTTNRPEQTLTSAWWITTFTVSPAIDVVNFTSVILQSQSLLISKQAEHIHALIVTLTTMFGVEMEEDAVDDDIAYESFASLRIPVDAIVLHIKDQARSPSRATTTWAPLTRRPSATKSRRMRCRRSRA
jgi:hypothetical protein